MSVTSPDVKSAASTANRNLKRRHNQLTPDDDTSDMDPKDIVNAASIANEASTTSTDDSKADPTGRRPLEGVAMPGPHLHVLFAKRSAPELQSQFENTSYRKQPVLWMRIAEEMFAQDPQMNYSGESLHNRWNYHQKAYRRLLKASQNSGPGTDAEEQLRRWPYYKYYASITTSKGDDGDSTNAIAPPLDEASGTARQNRSTAKQVIAAIDRSTETIEEAIRKSTKQIIDAINKLHKPQQQDNNTNNNTNTTSYSD